MSIKLTLLALALIAAEVEAAETLMPINVGLAPYVDVNSHFENPRNHVSLDLGVGLANAVDGAAIAGIAGLVETDVTGAQLAGVGALTFGRVTGAQLGGVFGWAASVRGAQAAPVSIVTGAVEGAQLGTFAYAAEIRGAQLGVINIAGKVTGAQVGIINIAEEVEGATFGLLNFVLRDGTHALDVYSTDTASVNAGVKLGSKHLYSVLTLGLQPTEGETTWLPGAGIGGHIPLRYGWSLDLAALAYLVNRGTPWSGYEHALYRVEAIAKYELHDRFALFAGPALNILEVDPDAQRLEELSHLPALATADSTGGVDLGLGFVLGLQVF